MSNYLEEIIVSIGAIGTFLLALASYWNLFKPLKPKLNICSGTTGEYLASGIDNQKCGPSQSLIPVMHNWYRLKVENKNKIFSATAKNVYIRFTEICKMSSNNEWKPLEPFNPFKMRWTSGTDKSNYFSTNLGKGEHLYINFFTIDVVKKQNSPSNIGIIKIIPGHEGIKSIALPLGFPEKELCGDGKFKFKISIFGDNVKSKQYEYEVDCSLDQNCFTPNVNIKKL